MSKAFSINCFPNPTADKVTISCNEIPPSGFYIKVVNIQGKTVLKSYNYSNSQHVVDLSDLTNGVYFLSVNSDEINQTFKIIKSK